MPLRTRTVLIMLLRKLIDWFRIFYGMVTVQKLLSTLFVCLGADSEGGGGGLGLHNFCARIEASRVAWIKRMVTAPSDLWTDFLVMKCNVESILDIPLRKHRSNFNYLSKYYNNIFKTWQKVNCSEPNLDVSIRSEPIWFNRFTRWQSLRKYAQIWYNKGMRRVNDIMCRDISY